VEGSRDRLSQAQASSLAGFWTSPKRERGEKNREEPPRLRFLRLCAIQV
jgi:hypothetical protein